MRQWVLVCFSALALAGSAFATAELQLTSGASTVTILDNGACTGTCVAGDTGDTNPLNGQMLFAGPVGSWSINGEIGISHGPSGPTIDLSSFNATSSGPSTLTVKFGDTDFVTPSPQFKLHSSGTLVSGSGTVTVSGYIDNTDAALGTPAGGLIGTLGPFSGDFAGTKIGGPAGVPLYSMTEVLTITSGRGGVDWSTDSSIAPVPEPGAIVLLGSALLLCAAGFRRRKAS